MSYEVTVTHTIRLPDGYELAPGPQPRIPQQEDDAAGYKLAWDVLSKNPADARASNLSLGGHWIPFTSKYFLIRHKPIGVKLVFVDVRRFEDIPKDGFYGVLDGSGIISGSTAKKHFENKYYNPTFRTMLVSYYATEPLYAPAS